jgi:hypothetical protein
MALGQRAKLGEGRGLARGIAERCLRSPDRLRERVDLRPVHAQQALELSALRPARIVFAAQQRPRDRPDVGPAEEPGQDRRVRVEARLDLRVVEILEAQPSRDSRLDEGVVVGIGAVRGELGEGRDRGVESGQHLLDALHLEERKEIAECGLLDARGHPLGREVSGRAPRAAGLRVSRRSCCDRLPGRRARSSSAPRAATRSRRNPSTQLAKTPPAVSSREPAGSTLGEEARPRCARGGWAAR